MFPETPLCAKWCCAKWCCAKWCCANTGFQNHHSGNRCVRIWLCTGRFPDQIPRLFGLCIQPVIRVVHSCADRCFRKVVFAESGVAQSGVRGSATPQTPIPRMAIPGITCVRICSVHRLNPGKTSRLSGLCIQPCERPVQSCADRCFRKHHFAESGVSGKWCLRKWCSRITIQDRRLSGCTRLYTAIHGYSPYIRLYSCIHGCTAAQGRSAGLAGWTAVQRCSSKDSTVGAAPS